MRIPGWLSIVALCCAGACTRRGFCPQDLTGTWTNPRDESSRYVFEDHGDTLTLRASGASAARPDAFNGTAQLQRSESALHGLLHTTAAAPSGKQCAVDVPVDVTSCRPNDVVLHRREDFTVGEDCAAHPEGAGRVIEFTVFRAKTP